MIIKLTESQYHTCAVMQDQAASSLRFSVAVSRPLEAGACQNTVLRSAFLLIVRPSRAAHVPVELRVLLIQADCIVVSLPELVLIRKRS
jgi:hypothetical protein